MPRTIKTKTTIRNIKTLGERASRLHAAKDTGIRLKEATTPSVVTPDSEQSPQNAAEAQTLQASSASVRAATKAATTGAHASLGAGARAKEHVRSFQQKQQHDRSATRKRSPMPTVSEGKRVPKVRARPVRAATAPAPALAPAKAAVMRGARAQVRHARTTTGITRAVTRGITRFAHMAAAQARSLAAALAAIGGGSVAMVVIVCLVGLIATSAFGVFFTGGDMGDGNPSMREMVARINNEHASRIEDIKNANAHDEVALSGSPAAWKETLAVFAVKTTTDTERSLDAITLDAERQQMLQDIFWDMNTIDSKVEEQKATEIVLEEDGAGNRVETSKESMKKVLCITLSHKSVDDIAKEYGFSADQLDTLHQLLDAKYDSIWQSVLYGIGHGSTDIVDVAASQIGNSGGQPYWSWYGFSGRVEWCACFVSWCANECGYIDEGFVPKFSYCPTGVQWFKDFGRWEDRNYAPQPGNIIFFDWQGDGVSDHVGIVESCDGSTVCTIEGNSGDACQRNIYSVGSTSIVGYGIVGRE